MIHTKLEAIDIHNKYDGHAFIIDGRLYIETYYNPNFFKTIFDTIKKNSKFITNKSAHITLGHTYDKNNKADVLNLLENLIKIENIHHIYTTDIIDHFDFKELYDKLKNTNLENKKISINICNSWNYENIKLQNIGLGYILKDITFSNISFTDSGMVQFLIPTEEDSNPEKYEYIRRDFINLGKKIKNIEAPALTYRHGNLIFELLQLPQSDNIKIINYDYVKGHIRTYTNLLNLSYLKKITVTADEIEKFMQKGRQYLFFRFGYKYGHICMKINTKEPSNIIILNKIKQKIEEWRFNDTYKNTQEVDKIVEEWLKELNIKPQQTPRHVEEYLKDPSNYNSKLRITFEEPNATEDANSSRDESVTDNETKDKTDGSINPETNDDTETIDNKNNNPWYKNPWIISIICMLVLASTVSLNELFTKNNENNEKFTINTEQITDNEQFTIDTKEQIAEM